MIKINAVNTKRFISYGQMLQIFYLEVIKDSDDLVFTQNQTISFMFSSKSSYSIMRWKSHTIRNQPQGQDGLSTSEFKDNVNGLNLCTMYADDMF